MERLTIEHIRHLYLSFAVIFGDKFTKNYTNDYFVDLWCSNWHEGLAGITPGIVKEAIKHCRMKLDWPPSLAEFRRHCEQANGMPTPEEVMNAAIRGDFHHPMIKAIYDKIGSWDMRHDKKDVLLKKFNDFYPDVINAHRLKLIEEDNKTDNLLKLVPYGTSTGS